MKGLNINLSVSDEVHNVVAFVVIEKEEKWDK
jgi:phosphopantetheinyl transferase (holo-ACP synthase)